MDPAEETRVRLQLARELVQSLEFLKLLLAAYCARVGNS